MALATYADAAAGADLVVNATRVGGTLEVLALAGAENLAGKPLRRHLEPARLLHGFPPTLFVKDTDSLGEQVQRAYPEARVVKTLNTLNADLMVHPQTLGASSTVFVSGDDADAKATVTELLTLVRPRRRHRPRRHRDRPRGRDVPAGVAAADGRAGHRAVQLQGRALTPAGGRR